MSHGDAAKNPALHDVASYHPHGKSYLRTGVILTLITAVEIGILYVPQVPADLLPPIMIVLAVVKFAMVVGLFMHLAEDRNVFRIVFIAPLFLALATIIVLGMMVNRHWDHYAKTYARVFTQKSSIERLHPEKLAAAAGAKPKLKAEEYDKLFADAKGDFSKGEAIFKSRCSACHRADGGGMPGLGPNMTDDCYKHGGKIYDFVNVLMNGVPATAMVSMVPAQITDQEATDVALYVKSLKGKNVADGKECEGEKAP